MRGKAVFMPLAKLENGITPAYAGKSRYRGIDTAKNRDHPRLCGEKYTLKFKPRQNRGSPPPMRGKGSCCICGLAAIGITPAYAGKSGVLLDRGVSVRDHPRLCGEKIVAYANNNKT